MPSAVRCTCILYHLLAFIAAEICKCNFQYPSLKNKLAKVDNTGVSCTKTGHKLMWENYMSVYAGATLDVWWQNVVREEFFLLNSLAVF